MNDEPRNPEDDAMPEGTGNETTEAEEAAADPVEALAAENAEMKDQILRTLADMENLRRRTQKQVKDASAYAIANFARDMLSVGDNLRRALDSVPEEARAGADEALKSLLEGMDMTEREMLRTLEKHGVSKLDPKGERFDPNFHQAMFEVPNPDVPNQTVVEVVQSGYRIGERVLRPAMVGVAKGGPKLPKEQPAEAHAETATPHVPETEDVEPGAQVDKTA